MLRRRTNTSKMWFKNVTAKMNNDDNRHVSHTCYTVDCVLLEENQVDLIHIMYRGATIIQLRFAGPDAKKQFLEEGFRNRNEDSGNSSPVSNQSSTPSPPLD
ncbi:hypothetical protein QE152_g26149 [Popillia japonica]|uniref:Uncharacterized protein n=1 Tax=Popillia japonica TaxID=7064 RepID=A0AAW1JZC1_POPJA